MRPRAPRAADLRCAALPPIQRKNVGKTRARSAQIAHERHHSGLPNTRVALAPNRARWGEFRFAELLLAYLHAASRMQRDPRAPAFAAHGALPRHSPKGANARHWHVS